MTVKLHMALFPQVSLAVTVTAVVPIGKVLPLGGLQLTNGGGLQPPVAVLVKKTLVPLELVVVTVMFVEQFSVMDGRLLLITVTKKEQLVI